MIVDQRLPDTTGMKNEVILQKAHHTCYDNQLTDAGVKLIDVETPADVRRAMSDAKSGGRRTVLMRVKSEQGTRFVALPLGDA